MESLFRLTRDNIGSRAAALPSGRHPRVINLLPLDSTLPNLALEKVAMHYRAQGYAIISDYRRAFDTETWASLILDYERERFASLYEDQPTVTMGGSGWSLTSVLPDEIEQLRPKINFGFTTRGCIRKCGFCVVPRKEGRIHPVGDLYDVWDRKANFVTFFDNNILAAPKHFELIASQLIREKVAVDFNQGLDIRLVDDKVAYLMSKLRFPKFPRFALDSVGLIPVVKKKLELLRKYKPGSRYLFYVLVRYDSSMADDLDRLNYLRSEGVQAFVMRYKRGKEDKRFNRMANWANSMANFRKYTFEEYVKLHDQHNKHSEDSPIVLLRKKFAAARGSSPARV